MTRTIKLEADLTAMLELESKHGPACVSVATLLQCLHMAAAYGAVPPIPEAWWDRVLPADYRPSAAPEAIKPEGALP
ncbi:hypothetical protein [uncultured Paracoccus sp.]|uniref:hypothetical protein n=1 Tax=uncultured Paracoccus sp. TaxID=189685 RepID=UPI002625AFDB|nr:hypothetical protein [uncultured Paracoccus sp.]